MTEENQVSKYDRLYGAMHDVGISTKPTTIKVVQSLTGESESFIVETCRHAELGDFIFIEFLDRTGVVRIALPPKVSNALAAHRDALTKRNRSRTARANMATRMANGWKPTPPGRRKKAAAKK